MKHETFYNKLNELKNELLLNLENQKVKKKLFEKFVKQLYKWIMAIDKIMDIDRKKGYQLIYGELMKIKTVDEINKEMVSFSFELITKVYTEKNPSGYLLYQLDKELFKKENPLVKKIVNHNIDLHTVRTDLECVDCGNVGAVKFYGKYNHRTKEMNHAVGFGGTIPYRCLKCNTVGLERLPMEGYKVKFKKIEEKPTS